MATYVIGDLQGCFEPLQRLLAALNYQPAQDSLWFCGDLIARGPDSLACLRFVKQLGSGARVVLGNHDLNFIAHYYGYGKIKAADKLEPLLAAPDLAELVHWLCQQPLLQRGPEDAYWMLHAGLAPDWDIPTALSACADVSRQLQHDPEPLLAVMYGNLPVRWADAKTPEQRWRYTINACTRMRFCHPDGALELSSKAAPEHQPDLVPWYEFWRNKPHPELLFGHWAALNGLSPVPGIHALDTGCVWGNLLTAYCVESRQRYSVRAEQQ